MLSALPFRSAPSGSARRKLAARQVNQVDTHSKTDREACCRFLFQLLLAEMYGSGSGSGSGRLPIDMITGTEDLKIFSKNPKKSIFVRDLPYSCTFRDLAEFFSESLQTPVVHAVVCKNRFGRTLQIGYVLFQSEEAVQMAVERLNGCRFIGRDIRYDNSQRRPVITTFLLIDELIITEFWPTIPRPPPNLVRRVWSTSVSRLCLHRYTSLPVHPTPPSPRDPIIYFVSILFQQPLVTEATLRASFDSFGEIDHVAIRTHKFTEMVCRATIVTI